MYGFFPTVPDSGWFLNLADTPILFGSSYFYMAHMLQRRPELRRGQPSPRSEFNPTVSVELQRARVTESPCSEQPKTRNKPTVVLLQHQLAVGIQREMALP